MSLTQMFVAHIIVNLGFASPRLFEKLMRLLDRPHWRVRVKAIKALGKLSCNIPDTAIQRLLELRHDADSKMRAV
jgi:HEAT repeat protein